MIQKRTNEKLKEKKKTRTRNTTGMTKTDEMVEIMANTFKCKRCKRDHEPSKLTPGEFNLCTFCSGWGSPK